MKHALHKHRLNTVQKYPKSFLSCGDVFFVETRSSGGYILKGSFFLSSIVLHHSLSKPPTTATAPMKKDSFAMNEYQRHPVQCIYGWERKWWIIKYECYHNKWRTDEAWFATCCNSWRGTFWFTTVAFIFMHLAKVFYPIAFKIY